jgi:hypothetical protein
MRNAYAPKQDKDELTKDQLYYRLEQTYEATASQDVKMTVGDLNAQVGKEEAFPGTIGLHRLTIRRTTMVNGSLTLRQARTWSPAQHPSPLRKYTSIRGSPHMV